MIIADQQNVQTVFTSLAQAQAAYIPAVIDYIFVGRATYMRKAGATDLTTADGAKWVLLTASFTYPYLAPMLADASLTVGDIVQTHGYTTAGDSGEGIYEIVAAGTGTDDGGSFIDLTGISGQAKLLHNNTINPFQWGCQEDDDTDTAFDSADRWNTAFWFAASLARDVTDDGESPIRFVCTRNIAVGKTLHASREPASAFVSGGSPEVEIFHPGRIRAIGGSTFEAHLDAEMARLTTLHGSTVALGSALAAKFLKADPQIAEDLGDKIERPLPIINISNQRSNMTFGLITCDFWCSGVRLDGCTASALLTGGNVYNYRKYGILYTKRSNSAFKTYQWNVKQWVTSDNDDHGGRMMPGGFLDEPDGLNCTGDAIVSCQKDMIWFGGTYGWGRSAIVLTDAASVSDRWAGRTMYPDYFTRWDDSVWDSVGGPTAGDRYDYMAPSTATGDNNFIGTHVMQGFGAATDDAAPFRKDGLSMGGQTGIECWNSSNRANFINCDVDTSITQIFGTSIRFFSPTTTVGNTAKYSCFHPVMRVYAARRRNARLLDVENWDMSIGFYDFDLGDVGAPNVQSFAGDYEAWNYRNRVDSGSHTGAVQYRGNINSTSGLSAANSAVVAAGDFFHVTEAGTYGGQAMALGDIVYALTTSPGSTWGSNWHLGENNDVPALTEAREVAVHTAINTLIPQESDDPALWLTKAGGDNTIRLETADGEYADITWGENGVLTIAADRWRIGTWANGITDNLRPITDDTYALGSDALRPSATFLRLLNLKDLPTSASGLSTGDVWNDSGTLKIV